MENFAKETLIAIKEYYIQENTEEEQELVVAIFRSLYHNTTDSKMKFEILEYMWDNKFCVDCGQQLQFYGEKEGIEFWDCPCSREV